MTGPAPAPTAPTAPTVIGIDIGGTTIKGLRQPDGRQVAVETPPAGGIVAATVELVDRLRDETTVAVGVAVPGLVVDGTVAYAANLGWRDVPLRPLLEEATGLPVIVEHDTVAAASAEELPDLLYVSIGTGIAAAMVVAGQPWRGQNGWAGEFGHVPVRPGGERCRCGQRGCLEVYASGAGIERRHLARTGNRRTAGDLAERGEREWRDAVDILSDALATAVLLLDPASIVVAGGVSLAGDLLTEPLRVALQTRLAWRPAPPLEMSRHGADGGCLGAARLARALVPA